jgi:glutamyl-tRNA synthetase
MLNCQDTVIGRIAPSPTGHMHLGNAFSALLAWAWARSRQGAFVLRLEDLDDRCAGGRYVEDLIDDLRWLGIDWDGKPVVQSDRIRVYEKAIEHIARVAEVYPCFCSRADLHAASAPHASDGVPVYAGSCYGMSPDQCHQRSLTRNPALRLHVTDGEIGFIDGLMGEFKQDLAHECGDFVLRRSDGVFAYQLTCVADDAENGITDVVRASDLLSSTPRQLLLYRLLDKRPPRFFHHPLLIGKDGRRLSKRNADLTISTLRKQGARSEQVIGYLATLCGHADQGEECTSNEFASRFNWSNVPVGNIVVEDPLPFGHA